MKISSKKILSVILAGILAGSSVTALSVPAKAEEADNTHIVAETQDVPTKYNLADSIQNGTILHCFTWKYRDITEDLPNIAKAGFTSIQVSPAQNTFYEYYPWYIVYQPYGFKFFDPAGIATDDLFYMDRGSIKPSQFNTREELEELCAEAEKYGINIIMDVVSNHLMKDILKKAGSELAKDEYWHDPKPINNYERRSEITNGSLSGLDDINTENEYIQKLVRDYVLELKGMGVDGIRWDAAKHIALPSEGSDFWKVVTDTGLYNYGEILGGPVDNKDHDELMSEYAQYMSVTDSDYGNYVCMAFYYKKAPTKDGNWTGRGIEGNKLVYWGESYDTYSNGQPGSCDASQNVIDRAYAIVAARADATSLYFSRPDSILKSEIFEGDKGSAHFIDPEVSAVNHFHNAMVGKKDCFASTDKCAVVTRENGGAVLVCVDETGEVTIENAGGYAVPGTYIDEVSGNTFVVTEDTITGTVGETGIAVIYDSPFIGYLYAEEVKSNTFIGEMSVTLRSVSADNRQYKLTQTTNGEVVSVETNDFADRDTVTFGAGVTEKSEFTLELNGKSVTGREIHETYKYVADPAYRPKPEITKRLTHITFDNSKYNWSDVYVRISCIGKGQVNGDLPGVKMSDSGFGYFTYEISASFNNDTVFNVTFSDGKGDTVSESRGKPMIMHYGSYGILDENDDWITNFYGIVGDVNDDGKVTSKDALVILRGSISSANEDLMEFGDINMDSKLTAKDAMYVLRYTINYNDRNGVGMIIAL